jgi:hypothetical protein
MSTSYTLQDLDELLNQENYDFALTIIEDDDFLYCSAIHSKWFKTHFIKEGKLLDHPLTRKVLIRFKHRWRKSIVEPIDRVEDIKLMYSIIPDQVLDGLFKYNKIDLVFSIFDTFTPLDWDNKVRCSYQFLFYFMGYIRREAYVKFANKYPEIINRIEPSNLFDICIAHLTKPGKEYFCRIKEWEEMTSMVLDSFSEENRAETIRVERALYHSNYKLVQMLYDYGYPVGPEYYKDLSKSLRGVRPEYYQQLGIKFIHRDHPVWRAIAGRNYKRMQEYINVSLNDLPRREQMIRDLEQVVRPEEE